MKKALSLILALVMCLSLCACGGVGEMLAPATKNSYEDVKEALIGEWGWILVEGKYPASAYVLEFESDGHGTKFSYWLTGSGKIEKAFSWSFTYKITDSHIICKWQNASGDKKTDKYNYTYEDGVLRIGVSDFYREFHKDTWLDGIIESLRKNGMKGLEEKYKAYIDYDE